MIASAFQANGLTPPELLLLALYTLLILWVSTSFWTATMGFFVLMKGGDPSSIAATASVRATTPDVNPVAKVKTVIVMPVYNEDPTRVFAGLRAIWQSLCETGQQDDFELFVLSDTRNPGIWMEEEKNWYRMCQDFDAHGKIFYRNREKNIARKSGNIEEFCSRWGSRYEYMIVLDADSLMEGQTLAEMVRLMDMNPGVALIQTPPLPVNHHSLFARILQFASSLYADIFTAGSSWWQLSDSNYWGHNAIIRIQPFIRHCGLPKLPGNEPFGGEILSHDFVEAALLREAGWEVWLAYQLKGSYEELPPTLIDYAKRDRRWCQGNLQHLRMIFSRNISGMSRLHFMMGIMSYLSSPLWLFFLIVTGVEAYVQSQTMPVYFFGNNIFPVWPESYTVEMTTVLMVTLGMLFLPKFWALVLLFTRKRPAIHQYGGSLRVIASVILESLFSILTAPILMLYQTNFVLSILLRRSVGWSTQNRDDHRLRFREAAWEHGGHTLLGLLAAAGTYYFVPSFFWWFTPVLLGLIMAIPTSMLSSSAYLGQLTKKAGIFLTPEEHQKPGVIALMEKHERLLNKENSASGVYAAVLQPGACALHAAMLPQRTLRKRQRHQLNALLYQLIEEGPENISAADKRLLIGSPEILIHLHTLAWSRDP
jgi:membrane glycosyltransferase